MQAWQVLQTTTVTKAEFLVLVPGHCCVITWLWMQLLTRALFCSSRRSAGSAVLVEGRPLVAPHSDVLTLAAPLTMGLLCELSVRVCFSIHPCVHQLTSWCPVELLWWCGPQ